MIYLELTRTPAGVPLLAAARLCTARRTPFVFVISSVASFQCPPPDRPVLRGRRSCKGNNFFPFRKTLTGFFSAAGTAVPRLRLQRYYHFSLKTKFFPNFFQKKFTLFHQRTISQIHTATKFSPFLCPKTYLHPSGNTIPPNIAQNR